MKQVKDAILHFLRSVAGYVLFYGIIQAYSWFSGLSPFVYFIGAIILLEVLNWVVGWVLKRAFGFDPLFVYQMPVLVYAFYRMMLEMIFLLFLFTILGFRVWLVLFVGVIYLFGVIRHSIRVNRLMIEGRLPGNAK